MMRIILHSTAQQQTKHKNQWRLYYNGESNKKIIFLYSCIISDIKLANNTVFNPHFNVILCFCIASFKRKDTLWVVKNVLQRMSDLKLHRCLNFKIFSLFLIIRVKVSERARIMFK